MSFVIQELEEGIRRLIDIHGKTSKATVIRELFEPLTDAVNDGIGLELLSDHLSQQGLTMSKHYLRNTLYRIRKERGISPQKKSIQDLNIPHQKQHQTVVSDKSLATPKTEIDYQARYYDIDRRYKAANTAEEKYAILGGDPKKLDGHPPRKQREMCIQLKMKIHNQYKPFITF